MATPTVEELEAEIERLEGDKTEAMTEYTKLLKANIDLGKTIEWLEGALSDAFIHGYWSAEADNDTACSEKRRKHWKRFKAALDKGKEDE